MSSLTISHDGVRLSKPCSAGVGLKTRTLATPGSRCWANASRARAAAGALLGGGAGQILVGDPLVETAGEGLGFLAAGCSFDGVEPVESRC